MITAPLHGITLTISNHWIHSTKTELENVSKDDDKGFLFKRSKIPEGYGLYLSKGMRNQIFQIEFVKSINKLATYDYIFQQNKLNGQMFSHIDQKTYQRPFNCQRIQIR